MVVKERVLDLIEDDMRACSGLVEAQKYEELFERYVANVNSWVKGEKMPNPITGGHEEPDAALMAEVEALLDGVSDTEAHRHSIINTIAAWAIERPDEPVENARVFASQIEKIRDSVYGQRVGAMAKLCRNIVALVRDDGVGLDEEARRGARNALDELARRCGYIDESAVDAAAALLRERYMVG